MFNLCFTRVRKAFRGCKINIFSEAHVKLAGMSAFVYNFFFVVFLLQDQCIRQFLFLMNLVAKILLVRVARCLWRHCVV